MIESYYMVWIVPWMLCNSAQAMRHDVEGGWLPPYWPSRLPYLSISSKGNNCGINWTLVTINRAFFALYKAENYYQEFSMVFPSDKPVPVVGSLPISTRERWDIRESHLQYSGSLPSIIKWIPYLFLFLFCLSLKTFSVLSILLPIYSIRDREHYLLKFKL